MSVLSCIARSSVLAFAVVANAPVMGQWSTARLSQARGSLAATTVDSKALFAGGALYIGTPPSGFFTPYSSVDIYDDATSTWSSATLSQARWSLAATTVGTKAMFAGGVFGQYPHTPSDVVDIYDGVTGTWSTATLSQPRSFFAATTVGTKAMFAGGTTSSGVFSAVVDIYDDVTGIWSIATLTQPRVGLGATTVGTKAMFADGDTVDIYDDATGMWTVDTLPTGTDGSTATTVGTKVMFPNGDTVDIYDDATGMWSTAAVTPGLHAYLSIATTVGTKVLIIKGTRNVDIYDDATGMWSTTTVSQVHVGAAATTVGTKAMFGGGHFGNGASDLVSIYDDSIGTIYCSPAVANSTGMPATITGQGFPGSVAQGYTLLAASQIPPGEFGYFLAGQTQGMFMPANSQGFICLSGNIGRYQNDIIQGPSGTLEVDLTAIPVNPTQAVLPGETWSFQCWYRDSNPGATSNFTDAVGVTFL